jgi:prophage regulatory protein
VTNLNLIDDDSYLRLPEVMTRTGLSESTIYRLVRSGEFPSPRKLGANAVGWKVSAYREWSQSRPDAREQQVAELVGASLEDRR